PVKRAELRFIGGCACPGVADRLAILEYRERRVEMAHALLPQTQAEIDIAARFLEILVEPACALELVAPNRQAVTADRRQIPIPDEGTVERIGISGEAGSDGTDDTAQIQDVASVGDVFVRLQ